MLRVALVGYGYWGPNLARCIAAHGHARLCAICEPRPERAAMARNAHARVPVLGDVETLLCDSSVDAVVLATPTATHGDLAVRALRRGKHVLVEKPLAGNSTDAMAMAEAGMRYERVLMVDHTYLFSPAFETIRGLITDRGLGPVRYYHSIRANCFGPAHETGVMWDLAVHDLSMLDVLMPSPPRSVEATGLRQGGGQREAHVQMTMAYPGGAMASVLVSWIAPAKVRTVVLGFDHHTICWDDLVTGSSVQLFDRGVEAIPDPADRRQPHSVVETVPVPPSEPLANVVRHFLESIAQATPSRSDAAAGVRTVRLLEAAERSLARSGRPERVELATVAA